MIIRDEEIFVLETNTIPGMTATSLFPQAAAKAGLFGMTRTVTPDGGEPQHFKRGDLITFPAGMSCTWSIEEDVEKHYDFQ